MTVFDRWGGVIFYSNNIEYGWNGFTDNNTLANNGKYIYQISIYDYKGKHWVYNGELNLFR